MIRNGMRDIYDKRRVIVRLSSISKVRVELIPDTNLGIQIRVPNSCVRIRDRYYK